VPLLFAGRVAAKAGISVVLAMATPPQAEKRSDITLRFVTILYFY
jgi:hypothetical protein